MRGYARVSTREQNLESQMMALARAGCHPDQIYIDRVSGIVVHRPGLSDLLRALVAGDVLVVWRLDRLGRRLRELIDLVDELKSEGIQLMSLTETIDTRTPAGELAWHMFAAIAQYERSQLHERINAGIAAARARGQPLGRPRALSPIQVTSLRSLAESGHNTRQLSLVFHVSERTVREARAGTNAYAVAPGPPAEIDWKKLRLRA